MWPSEDVEEVYEEDVKEVELKEVEDCWFWDIFGGRWCSVFGLEDV